MKKIIILLFIGIFAILPLQGFWPFGEKKKTAEVGTQTSPFQSVSLQPVEEEWELIPTSEEQERKLEEEWELVEMPSLEKAEIALQQYKDIPSYLMGLKKTADEVYKYAQKAYQSRNTKTEQGRKNLDVLYKNLTGAITVLEKIMQDKKITAYEQTIAADPIKINAFKIIKKEIGLALEGIKNYQQMIARTW